MSIKEIKELEKYFGYEPITQYLDESALEEYGMLLKMQEEGEI